MKLLTIPLGAHMPTSHSPKFAIVQYVSKQQAADEVISHYERQNDDISIVAFVDKIIPYGISMADLGVFFMDVVYTMAARDDIKKRIHYIESDSINLTYEIQYRDEDGWTCTCPAFKHRLGHCKHIKKVINNPREYSRKASDWR